MALLSERKEEGHFAHGFVMHLASSLENQSTVTAWELGQKDKGATYGRTGECGLAVFIFTNDDFTKSGTELSSCAHLTLAKVTAFNTDEGLMRKTSWIPAPPPLALERSGDAKPSPWPWGTGSMERRKHPLKRR